MAQQNCMDDTPMETTHTNELANDPWRSFATTNSHSLVLIKRNCAWTEAQQAHLSPAHHWVLRRGRWARAGRYHIGQPQISLGAHQRHSSCPCVHLIEAKPKTLVYDSMCCPRQGKKTAKKARVRPGRSTLVIKSPLTRRSLHRHWHLATAPLAAAFTDMSQDLL